MGELSHRQKTGFATYLIAAYARIAGATGHFCQKLMLRLLKTVRA
jgi:hypothetical protein